MVGLIRSNCKGIRMHNLLEVKRLSKKEKLRIMEEIWEDLSKEGENLESPEWHRGILEETERKLNAGQVRFIDWKIAKKKLRELFD
jgi:hypothetical protein